MTTSLYESAISQAVQSIDKNALLVSLNISHWSGRVKDYKVSCEVAQAHNAAPDSGVYWKRGLAKQALAEINACIAEARACYYLNTLSYPIKGFQILMAVNYQNFTTRLRDIQTRYFQAVDKFCDPLTYRAHKDEAMIILNGLYNEGDYPMESEIRGKFDMSVGIHPLPVDSSFQANIGPDADLIREEIKNELSGIMQGAMTDTWGKVYSACVHLAERLDEPVTSKDKARGYKIFHDTVIDNLKELMDILPSLNILNDPKLDEMKKNIEDKILNQDPKILRDRPDQRKAVCIQVQDLVGEIEDYLGEIPGKDKVIP